MRKQIGALALAACTFFACPALANNLDSVYLDAGIDQLRISQTAAQQGDMRLACFYARSSQPAFLRILDSVEQAESFYELSKKFEQDYCA